MCMEIIYTEDFSENVMLMYIINHQEKHLSCTVLKLFFHGMFYFVLFLQDIYRYLKEHTVLCHFCTLEYISHSFTSLVSMLSPKSSFLNVKSNVVTPWITVQWTFIVFRLITFAYEGLACFMEPPVGQVVISVHIVCHGLYIYICI